MNESIQFNPGARLTWDEVADIYQKNNGGTPRTLPMKTVFNSVKRLPFIHMDEEGYLYRIESQPKQQKGKLK